MLMDPNQKNYSDDLTIYAYIIFCIPQSNMFYQLYLNNLKMWNEIDYILYIEERYIDIYYILNMYIPMLYLF